jgi:hypothetical protein
MKPKFDDSKMYTQDEYEAWKSGYDTANNAAIRELRTPLQLLLAAVESGDATDMATAKKLARRGLDIYESE